MPEYTEYKKLLDEKAPGDDLFAAAGRLHDALIPYGINERRVDDVRYGRYFKFEGKNSSQMVFDTKALEHDTNKETSDTDYLQSAAELNDVYQPAIISHLNELHAFYARLRKVKCVGEKYGVRVKTARNTAVGEYDEDTTITGGNTTRAKLQQPMVMYYAAVEVSGLMVAAARGRGGVGDIYSIELKDATEALGYDINTDLTTNDEGFAVGGECMGIQWLVDDGGTYATLYGLDRSGANATLRGTDEAMSSATISPKQLRKMIRTVVKNGANVRDLMFLMNYEQRDLLFDQYDDAQRFSNSNKARFGFEGDAYFDGVPILIDPMLSTSEAYLLDMAATFLAVLQAPVYSDLAKTKDTRSGFIKTYFNLICTAPNHNYKCTGFATS